MPLENTPPAFDDAAETALSASMQAIIDTLVAYNINLTKEDRSKATSVGPKRTAMALDYFTNKNDFPTLKPPFMNETEADAHWEIAGKSMNVLTKAAKIHELLDDLKLNSEHFAFQYALEGYAIVERGKEQNVPGADTFYDMLSPYFAQTSGNDDNREEPTDPTEPVPPMP